MILLVGKTYFKNVLLHAAQRSGIAEGGIFYNLQPATEVK
jgi:hypothetical protein